MKKHLVIVAAVGLMAGGFALPAMAGHGGKQRHSAHASKQGAGGAHKGFDAADANRDGRVSLGEFKASRPNMKNAEKRFAKRDLNHDGFITKDEWQAAKQHHAKGGKHGKGGKAGKHAGLTAV